jgi:hypothetical protein
LAISNQRQFDPVIRAKYKAQLVAWKLNNPRTRAASLFFALGDPSDVSVEDWLRSNRDVAIDAIRELDIVNGMDVEYLLLNWLEEEEELVFYDVEKLLGGEKVSELVLQLGMTLGDSD